MAPRVGLTLAAIGVYTTAVYGSFHIYRIVSMPKPLPGCSLPENQPNYTQKYNEIDDYDSKIDWDELLMGLPSKRRYLASKAHGNFLEVSAGTGRNLSHLKADQLTSANFIDSSAEMLKTALVKFRPFRSQFPSNSNFVVMDSQKLSFKDDSFDTVLDTFGLCSHHDPVQALREMSRTCKPDGRILLLEHGKSSYDFINEALDKTASNHAQKWGCWWNRDILSLIQSADLEIEELKRYHFGTTYSIIAKPSKLNK